MMLKTAVRYCCAELQIHSQTDPLAQFRAVPGIKGVSTAADVFTGVVAR
jgi:hypothetical protein